jgi:8-oxo-dGTP pyrophosphatase MutT (NUDIX family)
MAGQPILRPGARVILIDAADRVLLINHRVADGPDRDVEAVGEDPDVASVWATPGGGLEAGETPEQAAIRELREEVGLHLAQIGPCVWLRRHLLPWQGQVYDLRERYFVCRIESHEVAGHVNEDDVERDWVLGHRWWSLEEIATAEREVFVPRDLADLLPPLLQGEYPHEPFEVGI